MLANKMLTQYFSSKEEQVKADQLALKKYKILTQKKPNENVFVLRQKITDFLKARGFDFSIVNNAIDSTGL